MAWLEPHTLRNPEPKKHINITPTPLDEGTDKKRPISVEDDEVDKLVSRINDSSQTKKKKYLLVGGRETAGFNQ
jgi:hypothetical protein